MTPLHFRPLHPSVGAEVRGLDLSVALDGESFAALRAGVHRWGFVLARGQELSPAAEMSLAHRFGDPLPAYRPEFSHADHDPLVRLGNVREGGKVTTYMNTGGIEWHTDSPGSSRPPGVSMIYCVESEMPDGGGETEFVSTVTGYRTLPAVLRARIADLTLTHSFNSFNDKASAYAGTNVAAQSGRLRARNNDTHDAIVQTHPATGKPHLYVSHLMVKAVPGLGLPPISGPALKLEFGAG